MANAHLVKQASRLAKHGRYGDRHIIHISDEELIALLATGQLTRNPKTGMWEAFKLKHWLGPALAIAGLAFGQPEIGFAGGLGGAGLTESALAGADIALGGLGGSAGAGALGLGASGLTTSAAALADIALGGQGGTAGAETLGAGAAGGAGGGVLPSGLPTSIGTGASFSPTTGSGGIEDFFKQIFSPSGGSGTVGGASTGVTEGGMSLANLGNTLKGLPWSGLKTGLDLGSGLYGLMNAQKMKQLAQTAFNATQDPNIGGYRAQLAALMNDPNSVTNLPGYQFGMDQGRQAIQRQAAGSGGGGNEAIALAEFSPQYAMNFRNQELARLMQLSQGSPNAGSQLLQGNAMGSDLASRSLASIGYGVGRMAGLPQGIPIPGMSGWNLSPNQ